MSNFQRRAEQRELPRSLLFVQLFINVDDKLRQSLKEDTALPTADGLYVMIVKINFLSTAGVTNYICQRDRVLKVQTL